MKKHWSDLVVALILAAMIAFCCVRISSHEYSLSDMGSVMESRCGSSQIPKRNNQTNSNSVGAQICIHPDFPEHVFVLHQDGWYDPYREK